MTEVTVCLPVYNGAEGLGEALENLCRQSLADLRILVSDNASTDATPEIVARAARADSRITLIRQETNIGAVANFRALAERVDTPFMAWRAHDDLTDEDFLEVLLATLRAAPGAALAAPMTVTRRPTRERLRPFTIVLRPGETAGWRHLARAEAGWFYGLHRSDDARAGARIADERYPHVWGWDYVVILNALLSGGVTGTNAARFIHRLSQSGGRYAYSKAERRRIYRDFFALGDALAAEHGLSGAARAGFRLRLARLAGRRVVRWSRLF